MQTYGLDLYGCKRKDIEQWLKNRGFSSVHAKAVFNWIYRPYDHQQHVKKQLPAKVCSALEDSSWRPDFVEEDRKESRYDGTIKFVLSLKDAYKIEMVLMPEKTRWTLCVSSQVGCAQACSFCHTGRMGLKRDLSASEIVGQVQYANEWLRANPEWGAKYSGQKIDQQVVDNVVFMGMGEPLDNVEQVIRAIEILTDQNGLAIFPRKITVSTAGHLDGLKVLNKSGLSVGLAFSLHAVESTKRSQLMPINKRFPLEEVISYLREYQQQKNRSVFIQYTVIAGVNDSAQHAIGLVKLLQGINVKVNLIPLNPIDPARFQSPNQESLQQFQTILFDSGIRCMIRYSKGQDIVAACGQLVV